MRGWSGIRLFGADVSGMVLILVGPFIRMVLSLTGLFFILIGLIPDGLFFSLNGLIPDGLFLILIGLILIGLILIGPILIGDPPLPPLLHL